MDHNQHTDLQVQLAILGANLDRFANESRQGIESLRVLLTEKLINLEGDVQHNRRNVEMKLEAVDRRLEGHGERITALEHWRWWLVGAGAAVCGAVGIAVWVVERVI